jgi:nucleotide-binding universal stress UspA family protein
MMEVITMVPEIKIILYATDLSQNSSYAFYYAIHMARRFDAKLIILHAIEPIPIQLMAYTPGLAERIENKDRQEAIDQIQNSLDEFCKKVEGQVGAPCLSLIIKTLVLIGYPVEEILKTSDKEECDTIILGSHGKGLLKQTFLGSVSSAVLHRSKKPVFVIPIPSEKESIDWNGI